MVTRPRPDDPRPDTGALIREHYARLAQKLEKRPSLREFEAQTGFPRSTACRYLTPDVVERLAPRPSTVSNGGCPTMGQQNSSQNA
jgi:hypothetical protein